VNTRTGSAPSWYLQTAGAGPDHDYTWFALEPGDESMAAAEVVSGEFAGQPFRDLVSEREPSTLLGRRSDGAYVFYANRLRPPNVPEDGDYMGRPISVSLLGIAGPEAVTELVDAAIAVLKGRLAENLPVTWEEGVPVVARSTETALAPRLTVANGQQPRPRIDGGTMFPESDRGAAAELLASLTRQDFQEFPVNRPLLLASATLDVDDLRAIRPWLAVTPKVPARRPLKEGKKRRHAALAGAALVTLVLLVWLVSRLVGTN
jgi:hypothetical protein